MKVGFIGLGNMGRPMALNLRRAGFDLVVHNRTRSKADELRAQGAEVAGSPAELARRADLVLTCLADVNSTLDAYLGDDGIVGAARPGQVLADHATVDMETSRRMHDAARAKGVSFLDAPISGGPQGAADATLSIMAGGEAEAFEKALPAFQAMGKTVMYMGGPGAGTATKLANQLLVGVHSLASCEALLLAAKAGVDLEKLVHVLMRSWGASRMLERNAPRIIERDFGPSASPLRNIVKDLSIILDLAREQGLDLPAAAEARRVFAELAAEGKGECDITVLYTHLEKGP